MSENSDGIVSKWESDIEELKSIISVNQPYDFKSENSIYKGDKYNTYSKINDNLPVGLLRYTRNEKLGLETLEPINATTSFGLMKILEIFNEDVLNELKEDIVNDVLKEVYSLTDLQKYISAHKVALEAFSKSVPLRLAQTLNDKYNGELDVSRLSEAIENINTDDLENFLDSTGLRIITDNEVNKEGVEERIVRWTYWVNNFEKPIEEIDLETIDELIDLEKVLEEIGNIGGAKEVMEEIVDIKEEIVKSKEMYDAFAITGVNPDYVDILNLSIGGFNLNELENITTNAEIKPLIE